jgi:hypothetical protein
MGQAVPVGEVKKGFRILVLTYKDVRVVWEDNFAMDH